MYEYDEFDTVSEVEDAELRSKRWRLPGAAVRITRMAREPGWAYVVYVGDDREQLVEVSELTEIADEDYCHECGQIGCTADGR